MSAADYEAIRRVPIGPQTVRMGADCAVHKHRALVPIHVHHIWPSGFGGPDIASNRVSVCANGHYSIHAYLDLLLKGTGKLHWVTKRRYGKKVRVLAERGHALILSGKVP